MRLLNIARIRLAVVPRMVVAVVLGLALLSGIAPFKSAAGGNLCTMACCAAMPPHAAGSCHMEMAEAGKLVAETKPEPASDELCGLSKAGEGALKGIAAGVMGMKDNAQSPRNPNDLNLDHVTVGASDHCQPNSQAEDVAGSTQPSDSNHPPAIAAHSFVKPCPSECGGAAGSGLRRQPDAAALDQNAAPKRTSASKRKRQNTNYLIPPAAREHIHPRGPPVSFS